MDDLKIQLRRHYEGQQLPDDRVREILALGRAAGEARASRTWWRMAAAAAVLLGLGIFGATAYFSGHSRDGTVAPLAVETVAGTVVSYLADPAHKLALVSTDQTRLEEWLGQHGGPAKIQVPPAMAKLVSVGCRVIEVKGQKVYVMCFFLDTPPQAAPDKKAMVTVGPDGQMIKPSRPIVHLVVAAKAMFAAPPRAGDTVVLPLDGTWNCATWTRGDQVYLAAAILPPEQLAGLVAAL